jgi:chromosome segregation ATPase
MTKSEQEMRKEACVFGKSGKQLSKYQQRMNEMAGNLCVKNPLLLRNSGKLLELARKQVHESGYVYAKGKSRSRVFNPSTDSGQPSREKIDKQEREHRIQSIMEQIRDVKKHIELKQKRVEQAQTVQNFKLCDQLADEISSLKAKRRELETALRSLQQKQKKSEQYYARKANSSSTIDLTSDGGGGGGGGGDSGGGDSGGGGGGGDGDGDDGGGGGQSPARFL